MQPTVLATAAPEISAKVIGSRLGFAATLGSYLDNDGMLCENIREIKVERLLSQFKNAKLLAVYSDHSDDILLLENAELKFLVNRLLKEDYL